MHLLALFFLVLIPTVTFTQPAAVKYDPAQVSRPVRKLVVGMAKTNEIYHEAIGYAGVRTKQYDRFEALCKRSSDAELVALTSHDRAAVRGYAFWALARRHYNGLETILLAHANDEEEVMYLSGCSGSMLPVIDFMLWVVTPQMVDLDCMKLDDHAFELVRKNRKALK